MEEGVYPHPLAHGVFKPDDILTPLPGDQDVLVPIPVKVGDHGVVGHLVQAQNVAGKFTGAVILIPGGHFRAKANRAQVDIAITVNGDSRDRLDPICRGRDGMAGGT